MKSMWCWNNKENWYSREAKRLQRLHYWLGVPTVVLSAMVGTAVFVALGKVVDVWAQVAVGLTSMTAAVLAALQTFLRFAERAEQNRKLAAGFASLRREIEVVRVRWAGEAVELQTLESLKVRKSC
jgi:hypothetical protein